MSDTGDTVPVDAAGTVGAGVVVVDKPPGWTSHDVVARVRRLARTRRVGHAGTLDPMATGVLVVGVGRATRLLGYLAASDKDYTATVRLGESTLTDDAEGEVTASRDAGFLDAAAIEHAAAGFVGDLEQVPSSVSAVKVDGRRSYARVRGGEQVALEARPVHVAALDVTGVRRGTGTGAGTVDVDVAVTCSTGTYVRALARDLGAVLGVGGHLTALRRTRVGGFAVAEAHTLEELAHDFAVLPLDRVAGRCFPTYVASSKQAGWVRDGRPLPGVDLGAAGPVAVLAGDGAFLALYEQRGDDARAVAVFG